MFGEFLGQFRDTLGALGVSEVRFSCGGFWACSWWAADWGIRVI